MSAILDAPEIQILLGCSRRSLPPWMIAHVASQLERPIDWKLFLREAHRHAVLPLLGHHLHQYFWSQIPQDVRDRLMEASREAQRRNLALQVELLRLLTILDTATVPAIPLKGPIVAAAAYGNSALRMYADLDILIHQADLERARGTLEAHGYVPSFSFTPRDYRAYVHGECALPFKHSQRNIPVELHWSLVERYLSIRLPIDSFWQRRVPTVLSGRTLLTLSAEDLFTYLCIHAGKHQWERLEWVASVAGIIEAHPRMNWLAVENIARKAGVTRFVRVTLLLANRLLQTPLPMVFQGNADRDCVEELAAHAISNLFQRVSTTDDAHRRAKWYLFLLRARERWFDKARIILSSSFRPPHPADLRDWFLPSKLSFLYYILRPVRLMMSITALAWRKCTIGPMPLGAIGSISEATRQPQQPLETGT
jgi:hypothetical protein